MKNRRTTIVALFGTTLAFAGVAAGGEFSTMGDYVMHRQVKITGSGKVLEIPMKPLPLRVETDGVTVRVSTSAENDNWSTFTIYRSDGIGRQNRIPPGVRWKWCPAFRRRVIPAGCTSTCASRRIH
jgi:hypothetical protein